MPKEIHDLICNVREREFTWLTIGQLVTTAVMEKYGHLADKPKPDTSMFAKMMVEECGSAAEALKALPRHLPDKSAMYAEVQAKLMEML